MILGIASEEETFLAHIKIEAFEAAIAEAHNGILLAYVALGLMLGSFGGSQTMQHRQPDKTLWFVLQPAKEMLQFDGNILIAIDGLLRDARLLETRAHRGLDIGATKGGHFAQLTRHLYEYENKKTN